VMSTSMVNRPLSILLLRPKVPAIGQLPTRKQRLLWPSSVEEKSNLTYGTTSDTNGCSGNIPPIERLGFPGMCLQDAGNGVRGTDFVNGYPSGIHVGARYTRSSNKLDWGSNMR
jgi:hypothetical protein